LFKKGSKIPCIPGKGRPSLLLCGLENVDTNSAVYKHIEKSSPTGPTAIYGTSGAGKTRRTFEYLSENYGFYFVVNTVINPGSKDTRSLLEHVQKPNVLVALPAKIEDATGRTMNHAERIRVSKANLESDPPLGDIDCCAENCVPLPTRETETKNDLPSIAALSAVPGEVVGG
jgi:hypothetical protein